MTIITTATGEQYRRMEFVDAWGRRRVCDKRVSDLPKPHRDTCECCGSPVNPERSTMRFCSAKCRVKWNRQRKKKPTPPWALRKPTPFGCNGYPHGRLVAE